MADNESFRTNGKAGEHCRYYQTRKALRQKKPENKTTKEAGRSCLGPVVCLRNSTC